MWILYYPVTSPDSFSQPGIYVPVGGAAATPVIRDGYRLTVSAIFYNAPAGYCVLGNNTYWEGPSNWHAPGTAATPPVTLPYGTSTNLGYIYKPGGESQDRGCAWYGLSRRIPPGIYSR